MLNILFDWHNILYFIALLFFGNCNLAIKIHLHKYLIIQFAGPHKWSQQLNCRAWEWEIYPTNPHRMLRLIYLNLIAYKSNHKSDFAFHTECFIMLATMIYRMILGIWSKSLLSLFPLGRGTSNLSHWINQPSLTPSAVL